MLLVFPGCSATGPKFERADPLPGRALVVIYRKSALYGSGKTFAIEVNGQPVTELPNGGFFPLDAEPGHLQLNAVTNIGIPLIWSAIEHASMKGKVMLEFDAESDQTYYVKFSHGLSIKMEQVPEEKALKALHRLRMTKDLRKEADGSTAQPSQSSDWGAASRGRTGKTSKRSASMPGSDLGHSTGPRASLPPRAGIGLRAALARTSPEPS